MPTQPAQPKSMPNLRCGLCAATDDAPHVFMTEGGPVFVCVTCLGKLRCCRHCMDMVALWEAQVTLAKEVQHGQGHGDAV